MTTNSKTNIGNSIQPSIMVNPSQITHIEDEPHVSGDEFVRKNANQNIYYVSQNNGASYDIVIGTLRTYRNKESGEYVYIVKEERTSTVFKDEVAKYFNEQGEKNADVGDDIPPLDQAIEHKGELSLPTVFDAYGIIP